MKVGSQPLPVTTRVGAPPRHGTAEPPKGVPAVDRVELSPAAARAAAARALEHPPGLTASQLWELVGRVNQEAARSAETADLRELRRLMG